MNKNFLTQEEKNWISYAIEQVEQTTAGEIRVVVVNNTKKFKTVRAAAEKAFFKYGLNTTVDQTGVLIFLSVEEKRIEILADTGINAKVEQSTWDALIDKLAIKIRDGHPGQGICDLVAEIGVVLTQHFPIQPDDDDELSNDVIIEDEDEE